MDAPHVSPLVAVMLFAWIPIVLSLFSLLSSRNAVITAFLTAWLFLPVHEYEIKFFPEYNKMTATCLGIFCATLIFDAERILRFRPRWYDLPALVFVMVPFCSSLANGLGVYDGLSESFKQLVRWGLPYFLGRIYFNTHRDMRALLFGIFIGGLIYVPLCWYEIRFSPQLHRLLYGFHQASFVQVLRFGGFRPMVFLEHGLMVGMWMASATLVAVDFWLTRAYRNLWGIPMPVYASVLAVTTLFCKSTGAIFLLVIGVATLAVIRLGARALPISLLATLSIVYVVIRASGLWNAQPLIDVVEKAIGPDRAQSLQTRIDNEDLLAEKARQRLLFGWGGWGRSRIYDEYGKDISITDSLWIIVLGQNGIVGLGSLFAMMLLPAFLLSYRLPGMAFHHPGVGATLGAALIICLWMIDNCFNAMVNPIYVVLVGGLAGIPRVRAVRVQPRRVLETGSVSVTAQKPAVRVAQHRIAAKRAAREIDNWLPDARRSSPNDGATNE